MQINAFSKKLSVPTDTIRYYENVGLLQPKRLQNGYRDYDENAETQLKMIIVLKQLGFTLKEIGPLVSLQDNQASPECNASAIGLFDLKVKQLTKQITFLQLAVETLEQTKSTMLTEPYEQHQPKIQHAINTLFQQLKDGTAND